MRESAYLKFLEEEYANRKLSFYEKVCNFFGFIKIPLPEFLEKKFQAEIDFCHLRVKPIGVLLTAIFVPIIVCLLLGLAFFAAGLLSQAMIVMIVALGAVLFYYLFSYTRFLNIMYRSKASSEMALCVIYMSISLKITQNLESAVAFAAVNLTGPVGLDLKKLLWDLHVGNILSVSEGLDELSRKWKSENEEFVDAITLLKNSINEPPERAVKSVEEAVLIVLDGTKNRMKGYALAMRTPLKILNAFGILLPLLGMIFLPIMVIFAPEIARPELISFSYMVLLPFILYIFLRQYFYTRPYSYHQVAIKATESFRIRKILTLIGVGILCVSLAAYFLYGIIRERVLFSQTLFLNSLGVVLALGGFFILYPLLSILGFTTRNKEIVAVESELPVVLFQLSIVSSIGKPFEKSIEELQPRIRELKINRFLQKILTNIKMFGASLEAAIFDNKIGAIKDYPSRVITAVMSLVIDICSRGMAFLSAALKSMADFLKDADEVNRAADEILSEVTSDMQVQAWVFAPLAAGIVVGLMAMVIYLFAFFGQSLEKIGYFFNQTGAGPSGLAAFSFLLHAGKQIPFPFFQIIVGTYMVEVVYMLASFLGELTYGEDEVSKLMNVGKIMLIALTIYTISVCGIYFGITSFINLSQFQGLT